MGPRNGARLVPERRVQGKNSSLGPVMLPQGKFFGAREEAGAAGSDGPVPEGCHWEPGPHSAEHCPLLRLSAPHLGGGLGGVKCSPLRSCQMGHLYSARHRCPARLGLGAGKG